MQHREENTPRHRIGLALLLVALFPGLALAHYPWMTPDDYAPPGGEPIEFRVGWGHAFPGTDTLDAGRLESAALVGPDGLRLEIELEEGAVFTTPPLPGDGPWVLAARQAPGFYSRTPRGGQRESRVDSPDAMSCQYTSNAVKAVLGRGTGAVDHVLGDPLEIVPLASAVAAGEPLELRVLLHGRPWQGAVDAVYAGFEGEEGEYPVTTATDAEGIARVPLDRAGRWMVKAIASEPYPQPEICDLNLFNATVTLEAR
jgi:uncharacterized GH25 family protein